MITFKKYLIQEKLDQIQVGDNVGGTKGSSKNSDGSRNLNFDQGSGEVIEVKNGVAKVKFHDCEKTFNLVTGHEIGANGKCVTDNPVCLWPNDTYHKLISLYHKNEKSTT